MFLCMQKNILFDERSRVYADERSERVVQTSKTRYENAERV